MPILPGVSPQDAEVGRIFFDKGTETLQGRQLEEALMGKVCCRPRPTAGYKELFPIPVPAFHHSADPTDQFLRALIRNLNSLYSPCR